MILEAQRKEIKKLKIEDLKKKLRDIFELIENLSEGYKLGNHEAKYDILQKIKFELFIDNKKRACHKGKQALIWYKNVEF